MAISSATATINILTKGTLEVASQVSKPRSHCVRFRHRKYARLQMKAGATESPQEAKDVEFEGDDNSTSVEASTVPHSIISALNVKKILRGIPITDADHYGRLGIARGCPYDQVSIGYKDKYEELMKQELDEEELSNKMDLLKESYSILSSQEERRLYDWSLSRTVTPDRFTWPYESDITQADVMQGTPPPGEPEDFGPTRLVGYFFVAWLVLAFVSSIAFNL